MTTLSVVVPAYNEEAYLPACLDSLLRQTRPIDEIIVVDNDSSDATGDVARRYARDYPNIRVVHESRPGVASARRCGFDQATSGIIAKIDADSLPAPSWAAEVVGFFDSERGREYAAMSGLVLISDGPAPRFERWFAELGARKYPDGAPLGGGLHGPNYALRASAWVTVRDTTIDDDAVWEDFDIGLALSDHGLTKYYVPGAEVFSSCRRLRHSPWSNWHYLRGGIRTARARNHERAITVMSRDFPVRLLTFTGMWLLFRPWDNEKKNWRPHRLFTRLDRARPLDADRHAAAESELRTA
ncbi:hypothetical protein GCM10009624_03200 [Gordonia sinesedis]